MEEAEKWIQNYKGWVSMWGGKATDREERLGPLKKEGECRT